jgi:hypothetical protein
LRSRPYGVREGEPGSSSDQPGLWPRVPIDQLPRESLSSLHLSLTPEAQQTACPSRHAAGTEINGLISVQTRKFVGTWAPADAISLPSTIPAFVGILPMSQFRGVACPMSWCHLDSPCEKQALAGSKAGALLKKYTSGWLPSSVLPAVGRSRPEYFAVLSEVASYYRAIVAGVTCSRMRPLNLNVALPIQSFERDSSFALRRTQNDTVRGFVSVKVNPRMTSAHPAGRDAPPTR